MNSPKATGASPKSLGGKSFTRSFTALLKQEPQVDPKNVHDRTHPQQGKGKLDLVKIPKKIMSNFHGTMGQCAVGGGDTNLER